MGQTNKYNNYSFESDVNGDIDHDPNFDLDAYIRDKSQPQSASTESADGVDQQERSQFKNAVLIFMVFAAAFLWVNDWSVSQAWNGVFGNEEVTNAAPSFEVQVPEINIPEVPAPPVPPATITNQDGYVSFLTSLNEAGYRELFSNSQAIGLYNGGVSINYLNELNEAGYLDQFSYSAIIGLYNGGVTTIYLDDFQASGLLDEFSYSQLIGLYNGNVSVDYLDQLRSNGYLQEFSYSEIIGLFNADVTVSFLNQLEDNGVMEDMSYSDIIMAYNADN